MTKLLRSFLALLFAGWAATASAGVTTEEGSGFTVLRSGNGQCLLVVSSAAISEVTACQAGALLYRTDTGLFYNLQAGTWTEVEMGAELPIDDATAVVKGSSDPTKTVLIEADGLTTETARTVTVPDVDFTLVAPSLAQVFTASITMGSAAAALDTVTFNDVAGQITFEGATADAHETRLYATDPTVGDQNYLLPNRGAAVTDTLVSLAATQTLTGKTLTAPTISGTVAGAHTYGADITFNTYTVYASGNYGTWYGPGTNDYNTIFWGSSQTPDNGFLGVGSLGRGWLIAETADVSYDFAHPQQTNPTLWINSAVPSADQWGSHAHDQTNYVIGSGLGAIKLAPANGALLVTGAAPTVSSCGTSPSTVTGSASSGYFTWGSGGVDATCTLTFATALAAKPNCKAENETNILTVQAVGSTTTIEFAVADAATVESDVVSYQCSGGV